MRVRRGWLASGLILGQLWAAEGGAQSDTRIWGVVRTAGGDHIEGFVRWDRNEASWADVLDGRKTLDPELQDRVAEFLGEDLEARGRAVEFMGVRISWDDDGPGPDVADTGLRFGHLDWVRATGERTLALGLKSGEEIEFTSGSTDLGRAMRALSVESPDGRVVELEWRDLDRIDFGPAPPTAAPSAERLHGTVEDRWGDRWTGLVSWDTDEVLGSDVLDGEDERGRDREIRFERIATVEPLFEGGARVILLNGEEFVLRGSNDVDSGHRGIQVSDPELGQVSIAWRDVRSVRFSTPTGAPGYDGFDGGLRLVGTVTTEYGEPLSGRIIWDADEAWSWEMLDGRRRDIGFQVEFGRIARIDRHSSRSAEVTLRDGRVLILEGSNDVDRGNKGIVMERDDGTLEVVEWRDFVSAAFEGG